ncbi:ATP-binding protein [Paraburkholderia sp. RL17-373-BIF-A]|uniref:hypothetical protein n=1 Tax=Paraburkholderia sp. RL17-373-BIF-A TaxID=3031629 RepID=UPI0038BC2589
MQTIYVPTLNEAASDQVRIYVPTINDSPSDFQNLFRLWQQVQYSRTGAIFDFSNCTFLRPNAVAFLGGIARVSQQSGRPANFQWDSVAPPVLVNLCQSGFAKAFGHLVPGWGGHSIPYREDRTSASDPILDYLTDQWLGRGWLNISEMLRDAIVGTVWEVYANSFEHGQSPVGVFSCGQHFKNGNELILSVADFGAGIPTKVRQFLREDPRSKSLRPGACLNWAFQRGNSTAARAVARGLGLDLLREFVCLNDGSLEVYSENGHALINRSGAYFADLPIGFSGTMVQIKLKCDERFYRFKSETNS